MAEKETKNAPKDMIEPVPEEVTKLEEEMKKAKLDELEAKDAKEERLTDEKRAVLAWSPKTKLGRMVKEGKIKNIDEILDNNGKILEFQIVDSLLSLESDLLSIGQAKGKFGGGKRRAWRQTQKKTMEGNVITFSCMAVIGDKQNHVGVGFGKAKETLPSREKALRSARLNIIKIKKGFETKEEKGNLPHTVPFKVDGKCGSVRITLMPAPRGTGLVIGDQGKKILKLAGIEDVYAVTKGQTRTTFNVAKAIIDALKKTNKEILK